MDKTIVISSIYSEFWGSEEFRKSVAAVDLPLHNSFTAPVYTGNGDSIALIYKSLLELKDEYKYTIYSDGADSYFLKSFQPPEGIVIYSAEKAMWPPRPILEYPEPKTCWRYLNGGGYCSETSLLIEFFKSYGLDKLKGDVNGQLQQAQAYLQALKDGFPIMLDEQGIYFQTLGFEEPTDFTYENKLVKNNVTGTYPCVVHGNGRHPIDKVYNMFK